MSMFFVGVGTTYLGRSTTGPDGQIISATPPRFEPDPNGTSVVVGKLNPDTIEPEGSAEPYGNWQAAEYLGRVLELLHPNRQINIPNLKDITLHAAEQGIDICDYCSGCHCRCCIINEWKEERRDEQNED